MLLTSFHVDDELLHVLHIHIPNPVSELDHGELKSLLLRFLHDPLDVHILCKSIKKEIELNILLITNTNTITLRLSFSFSRC